MASNQDLVVSKKYRRSLGVLESLSIVLKVLANLERFGSLGFSVGIHENLGLGILDGSGTLGSRTTVEDSVRFDQFWKNPNSIVEILENIYLGNLERLYNLFTYLQFIWYMLIALIASTHTISTLKQVTSINN